MIEPPPILQTSSGSSQLVRSVQAIVFVGVWMALGWLFRLDTYSYLLAGIPLVIAFQVLVRKKPLVTLWIRNADRFRLNRLLVLLGFCLSIWPTIFIIKSLRILASVSPNTTWSWWSHTPQTLWCFKILLAICCIIGTLGAMFAFSRFTSQTWKDLRFSMLTAGAIGSGFVLLSFVIQLITAHKPIELSGPMTISAIWRFLNYLVGNVAISFVVEEVVFRGAIDSHVFQPGDNGQLWTAILVSGLWGLWHLPIRTEFLQWIIVTVVYVIPIGMFLSFGWRRSGNLAVSGTTHAFIDAMSHI
jgi:membrane protease YdiL (CAAX protease family)